MPSTPAVVRAAQAMRGLLTLKDFLNEAEVAQVEAVLVQCAREADFQVNEREYGQGKFPDDKECNRVVGHDKLGRKIRRSMELGTMKHEVAFACVERELGEKFPDHFTREPRYGKEPTTGGYSITDTRWDSLVPDLVLHFVRNANHIQRLYDFYFPCTASKKSNPLGDTGETVRQKLDKYKELSGAEQPALVTPQLGISR
ncbi:putative lipoprotein [Cystobacter fuscus DSM 2262]|uniref:Lipoprotein n=1 Tax=Cystobacter fuscus (strain ATCC 25194 / DSM 2262 / NBRC 100088 / M29) TaxID=1242864 RepID=S9P0C0_CYSF2|nr:putative lipoprotein [Cystobacter fuscus DSM 2262]